MKKSKLMSWIKLIFIIPLLLYSCKKYPSLPLDVDSVNINNQLFIYAPHGWNNFRIGDPITVVIDNVSDEIILFPMDFDIQAYSLIENHWAKNEKETIIGVDGNYYMYPSKGDHELTAAAMIFPIINDDFKQIVRITIQGNILIDGKKSTEKVIAFTDIHIYPQSK